jgi:hypothetical protein
MYGGDENSNWLRLNNDRKLLADAYLAEHAADDEEPVDVEWAEREAIPCNVLTIASLAKIKTRGGVRLLLRAMGVTHD